MGSAVELVRVRFVESVAGLTFRYAPHQEYDLSPELAAKFVANGSAVYVGTEPETAMEQNAPRRRGRPRKVETR